jgi:ATP-dependent RNA helicase RhlE
VYLLNEKKIKRTLVFTRTKHGAVRIAKGLMKAGIRADAIHGNKSQSARQIALINFKTGKLKVLVSRGIDVDALEHAINFDLPDVPETYVHHIGRTRREGTNGSAIFFLRWQGRR